MAPRSFLRSLHGSAVALLVVSACGGEAPPSPVSPPSAAASLPASPPPDLSAVAQPAGLVAFVRISRPGQALKTALGWAHLPSLRPADANRAIAGDDIGEFVDFDQPMDLAVMNGGRGLVPGWAVSCGVRSLDAARAGLSSRFTLAPGDNGAFWIRPAGEGKSGTTERPCAIFPAAGASPVRLVCGASEEALGYLAPYLTRTSPRQAWDKDVHLEVYAEPVKPFAKMMRYQAPALLESMLELRRSEEPALADLVEAVIGDLVDLVGDLGKVQIDLALDHEGASATLRAGLKSKTSLLAKMGTSHPERADVPLPSFWRLPDDSDTAFFSRGVDATDLAHARDLSVNAIVGRLGKEGLPDAEQKAVGAALKDVLTDAPFVYARGSDVVAVQKALVLFQSAKEGPAKDQAARAAVEPYLGWWVLGFEETPARLTGVVKALVAAWNRPATGKWLKTHIEGVPAPDLRTLSATGLPKESSHVALTVYLRPDEAAPSPTATPGTAPAKGKPTPPTPIHLHALVVPDSGRTWLVLAADEKLAFDKAKRLLSSATPGGPGTLATHPRLEPLREGRETGGGFTSLRGWVALSPEPNLEAPRGKANDPLGLLASLPSQGVTPIVFSTSPSAATDEDTAGAVAGQVSIPRAAIEDILLFAMKSGGKL